MAEYDNNITKEDINLLPVMATDNQIIVIDSPEQVEAAISDLENGDLIGFDTETKPSFRKGEHNTVSLLQLSNAKRCYLFRLQKIGKNERIKAFLENPKVRKVGLSVRDDFRALSRWMEMSPTNFLELQFYVKAFGIEQMSLQKIFAIVFRRKISKRQQLSNWEAQSLSDAQQLYAATDAWACRQIYYELRKTV
ncbi:MAG: 3'-5' exonuclease domain-containing protein 2 [Paludibacteraceae bacterium]|nr:3'-5' exonuclease domain-containing protein 2 [Paludibacteraceae bacterium]